MEIKIKLKEIIQKSNISLEELEYKTGIEKKHLKILQELPADEILLHEAILIANALGKTVEDIYEIRKVIIKQD